MSMNRSIVIPGAVVRKVKVQSPKQALCFTRGEKDITSAIVDMMPTVKGEVVEVIFFPLPRHSYPVDVIAAMTERGLEPHPSALVAVNTSDQTFADADKYPNFVVWKGPNGEWYAVSFGYKEGRRYIRVYDCQSTLFTDRWWVGGVQLNR